MKVLKLRINGNNVVLQKDAPLDLIGRGPITTAKNYAKWYRSLFSQEEIDKKTAEMEAEFPAMLKALKASPFGRNLNPTVEGYIDTHHPANHGQSIVDYVRAHIKEFGYGRKKYKVEWFIGELGEYEVQHDGKSDL